MPKQTQDQPQATFIFKASWRATALNLKVLAKDEGEALVKAGKALKKMEGVTNRAASFETVVAAIDPDGEVHYFTGKIRGTLLTIPRTKPQPKMPYSPIFLPDGEKLVWAEMTTEHENRISHRGIAFAKLKDFLIEYLGR